MAWKEIRVLSVERSEDTRSTQFTNIIAFSFLELHEEGKKISVPLLFFSYALTLLEPGSGHKSFVLYNVFSPASCRFLPSIFGWGPGKKVAVWFCHAWPYLKNCSNFLNFSFLCEKQCMKTCGEQSFLEDSIAHCLFYVLHSNVALKLLPVE